MRESTVYFLFNYITRIESDANFVSILGKLFTFI